MEIFLEWSFIVIFFGVGIYEGELIFNENIDCGDIVQIYVNIYFVIDVDFIYVYDICVAGLVIFIDFFVIGLCCLMDWDWCFGDGNISSQ